MYDRAPMPVKFPFGRADPWTSQRSAGPAGPRPAARATLPGPGAYPRAGLRPNVGAAAPMLAHWAEPGREGPLTGKGRGGFPFPSAREAAADFASTPVNWDDPLQTLQQFTQIDGNRGRNQGGHDRQRCGAAVLTAGLVLLGEPSGLDMAVLQLTDHIDEQMQEVSSRTVADARNVRQQLERARALLAGLARRRRLDERPDSQRSAAPWTHDDIHVFQEALYTVAAVDDFLDGRDGPLTGDNPASLSLERGLTMSVVRSYRDMLWGERRPQINGRPVDAAFISDGGNIRHFVLAYDGEARGAEAAERQRIAYDPWPEQDGSAYVRPEDDGLFHPSAEEALVPAPNAAEETEMRRWGVRRLPPLGPNEVYHRDLDNLDL